MTEVSKGLPMELDEFEEALEYGEEPVDLREGGDLVLDNRSYSIFIKFLHSDRLLLNDAQRGQIEDYQLSYTSSISPEKFKKDAATERDSERWSR